MTTTDTLLDTLRAVCPAYAPSVGVPSAIVACAEKWLRDTADDVDLDREIAAAKAYGGFDLEVCEARVAEMGRRRARVAAALKGV